MTPPEDLPDDTNPMLFVAMLLVPMIVIGGLWVSPTSAGAAAVAA